MPSFISRGIVFLLVSFVLTEQIQAQTCTDICSNLDVSIEFISETNCIMEFAVTANEYESVGVEYTTAYTWFLDSSYQGDSDILSLNSEDVFSGDILSIVSTVYQDGVLMIGCFCEISLDLQEEFDDFEQPCVCSTFPLASFNVVEEGVCGNEGIEFITTSSGLGLNYDWSFGDAYEYGQSSLSSPDVEIIINGGSSTDVPITLIVTDLYGCTDTAFATINILETPFPGYTGIDPICSPDPNDLTQDLILTPEPIANSGIESITIDWGVGAPTMVVPTDWTFEVESPSFSSFGYYIITIESVALNGCESLITDSIFIGTNPQIGTANPGNTNGLCSPYTLTFPISNFAANSDETVYYVDFGDGTPELQFNHPPPSQISHNFTTSSCGFTTPEGSQNAYRFRVIASNDCSESVTTVDPIRIHLSPAPAITGLNTACVEVPFTYSSPSSGVFAESNAACDSTNGVWSVIPLEGQADAVPPFGIGGSITTTFQEAGLYNIHILEEHESCGDGEDQMQVCVYPELNPQASHFPSNGCLPLTVQLNDITPELPCGTANHHWEISGGTYEWVSGSSFNDYNPSITLLEEAVYTVELHHSVPALAQCPEAIESFQIEVYDVPTIDIASSGAICEGESWTVDIVNISGGSDPNTVFSWLLDGSPYSSDQSSIEIPFSTAGEYAVQAEVSNTCGIDVDAITIVVEPVPVLEVIHPEGACTGDEIEIVVSGATDFTWSPLSGSSQSNTSPDTTVIQLNANVYGIITGFIYYSGTTCDATIAFDIEAYAIPQISLTGPSTICYDNTISIEANVTSGSPEYTINWIPSSDVIGDPYYFETIANVDIDILAEVSDINGCENTQLFSVAVLDLPTVYAGEDIQLCDQPIMIALNDNTPTGGIWFGDGIIDAAQGTYDPSILGVGSAIVTYQYTDGSGCTSSDFLTIDIFSPEEAAVGLDVSSCNTDSVIALTGYSPLGGEWVGMNVSLGEPYTINIDGMSPGLYSYTYNYGVSTCATSDVIQLEIFENPSVNVSPNVNYICDGSEIILFADVFGGEAQTTADYNIYWVGDLDINPLTPWLATWDASSADLPFVISVSDLLGCSSTSLLTFDVLDLPEIILPSTLQECNQPIEVTLPTPVPAGGVWSGDGILNGSLGTLDPGVLELGFSALQYDYTDVFGCSNSATTDIELIPAVLAYAGIDITLCDVDTILLLEGFSPVEDGNWAGNNVLDPSLGEIDISPLTPGVYSYTYEYGVGSCFTEDNMDIEIFERPSIAWDAPEAACLEELVEFEVLIEGGLEPYSIDWISTLDFISPNGFTASNTWMVPGVYQLEILVTDTRGCAKSSTIEIIIHDLPTVFAGLDTTFCDQPIVGLFEGYSPGLNEAGIGYFYGLGDALTAVTPAGEYTPTVSGSGVFDVVYTFTSSVTTCSNYDTLQVVIAAAEEAFAGLDTIACNNAPQIQLVGFTPDVGSFWSGFGPQANGALIDNQQGIIDPQLLQPGSHQFILEYGYGTCYTSDILVLEIDPVPVISLQSNDEFCANSGEVNLTDFSPSSGTWEGVGVVDASEGVFDAGVGVGTWDLFYWYTDPVTTCSDTALHQVLVQDIPNVFAGMDTVFCNQPIVGFFEGNSPGVNQGGDGYFYGIGPSELAVSSDGEFNPGVTGAGAFSVIYIFTDNTTQCINSDTLEVIVAEPTEAYAGVDTTACNNAPQVQLLNYIPITGISWLGVGGEASMALLNSQQGIIDPQLLSPGSHEFTIEYGIGTCYTSDNVTVYIDALPEIDLGLSEQFCHNLGEQVLNTASPIGGYWFGTNITDESNGLFETNLPEGVYEVEYTFTDPGTQCGDTLSHQINILPVPIADFSADILGCNNSVFPITQSSIGATLYDWNFGDGQESQLATPVHQFDEVGTYEVVLFATNDLGCVDTTETTIEVTAPPVAEFLLSENSGCAPLEIEISNLSYFPYSSFLWDLNGLTTTDTIPPIQQFLQGDSIVEYDIVLTVSNLCGTDIYTEEISVFPQPQMSFAILNDTVCSPYTAEIIYTGMGLPDNLNWDFGNGETGEGTVPDPPTYVVDSLITEFTVTLVAENSCGGDSFSSTILVQPNTVTAFFQMNTTAGCPPLQINVSDFSISTTNVTYDFGDGNYSSETDATNIYTTAGVYEIIQYVTNGCSYDTTSVEIVIHPEPSISISLNDNIFCEGEEAFFNVESTDTGLISWDFGDGLSGSGEDESHIYINSGFYTASATVLSNLFGCEATETITLEITPTPELDITALVIAGCSPLDVSFVNNSSDSDFWLWSFGDSSPAAVTPSPLHTFTNITPSLVQHEVTVTGSTINGCDASTSFTISVAPEPVADFQIEDGLYCGIPNVASVSNLSEGAVSFQWNLNFTSLGSEFEPTINVNQFGEHFVELTAFNSYGCDATSVETFTVYEFPSPQVEFSPATGCEPLLVEFTDLTIGAFSTNLSIVNADWIVYESTFPTEPVLFEHDGNYLIHITAISSEGCVIEHDVLNVVEVWPVPTAYFTAVPLVGLPGDVFNSNLLNTGVTFDNLSQGYVSSVWTFGDGGISLLDNPSHDFMIAGDYPVNLLVTSDMGCVNSYMDVISIKADLEIYVPNAFTPPYTGFGGNGINDAFRAEFSDLALIESFTFRIFNRGGKLIWETSDPEEYWIGEVGNYGEYYVPNEVYVWQIEIRSTVWGDIAKELRGHVTIIR